ncbi:YkvI family membrane protein [Sutcliffiella cohnii]|uniref:Membrane protein YkvI n=1 Tax=Sutcliffiella cohnii TaxID=33932 RepID=A0A223KWU3_9BACI|nr:MULTISPECIES: hypothetical protein [Sutcliffiella]AST93921.1 hypothetical protein BC6307_22920 [Sutcliffiella cohnii]MED4015733.1 hypothetical protein [Sutcliffiella cohnii]WBL15126.1 hypothetical protein O1A01_25260 [Sutcliffiella sp. NC1]
MLKNGLKWMFLILGTVIGAGYASGRELWQFFGVESGLAIFLFSLLFIVCSYIIMSVSVEEKSEHFSPVLKKIIGPKLASAYDVIIIVYLFMTTVVMLAGGGAALEVFSIPYWTGIFIICILLFVVFVYGVKGMITVNTFMLPVIVIALAAVLITFTSTEVAANFKLSLNEQNNWPSAFTFTALNILPLIAVLSAVGSEVKQKREIYIASIGSGVLLGSISYLYNRALITVESKLEFFEIPLFAIIQSYPYYMFFFMTLLLWVAIYTTAASQLMGIITRIRSYVSLPVWGICFIILVLMVPFTSFGFSTLVAILYPLFGIVNLYLLASILLYPIVNRN